MPNSWRTDTFMSGKRGTPGWASAMESRFWSWADDRQADTAPGSARRRTVNPPASHEPSLFQIVISLDDFPQLVFRAGVAAVGIGMVALYEFMEARFDLE